MNLKHWMVGSACAVALGLVSAGAQAATTTIGGGLKATQTDASVVEKVDYRRCWRSDGRRVCRWYRTSPYAYYGPSYYYDRPGYYSRPYYRRYYGPGVGVGVGPFGLSVGAW